MGGRKKSRKSQPRSRKKSRKSRKSRGKAERVLREHDPGLEADDPRVALLAERYAWLRGADLTRRATPPTKGTAALARRTGDLLRKTVAARLEAQYPALRDARDVDELMDAFTTARLRSAVAHIDRVYYDGAYGRAVRQSRVPKPRLFMCDRPRARGVYARAEWGGDKPIHLMVWRETFCDDAGLWRRGCRKRIDGAACDTPLEFVVGVVAHEMVHVLTGALLDRPADHGELFLRYNHYFNGSRPRAYENSSTCA